MLTEEALGNLDDTLGLILEQINSGDPGSEKQLRSAEIYKILCGVQSDEQKTAIEIDKMNHEEALDDIKRADDAKEKKWQHRTKVMEIVAPILGGFAGMIVGLNFEKTGTIVSGIVKPVVGKVIKFTK